MQQEQRFEQDQRAPIEQRKLSKRNFDEVPIPQTFNMSPTSMKAAATKNKAEEKGGNLLQKIGDKISGAFGMGEKKAAEPKPK